MQIVSCRARRLACALLISVASFAPISKADDKPLLWLPSKTADNSYAVTMGVRLPAPVETRIGADVAVQASKDGRIGKGGTPVKIWGALTASSGAGTARTASRAAKIQFNAVNGDGHLDLSNVRAWIASPTLDIESQRSLTLGCNTFHKQCATLSASQRAKLSLSQTGTAVVLEGRLSGIDGRFGSRFELEQTLMQRLDLSLSLSNPASAPVGSVTARYAMNW